MSARAIELPITRVTVLEDRAQVTRKATLHLGAGHTQLAVSSVAPVLADCTLVARATGAEVADARVERRRLERDERQGEVTELERELEAGEIEEVALDRERSRLSDRLEQLKRLFALRLDEAGEDAAWNREPGPVALEIADLERQAETALAATLAAQRRLEVHQRELKRLRRRVAELTRRPGHAVAARVILDSVAEREGEVEIEIAYVVPSAAWRPYHRAIVAEDHLTLETDGCIWQNTGEDWMDVELVLSTERLSLGASAPELASDELRVTRRQPVVQVETRDQRVAQASVERGPAADLPGIDDAGEPLSLPSPERGSVPGDGRPHRVKLSAFEAKAVLELAGRPELDANVHLVAKLENAGKLPLLAGPVDVIRAGGVSGRSKLDYVAPGEIFELGLGPDPDLRMRRDFELEVDEARFASSWSRTHHRVTVRISNLGRSERQIRVRERVPVSELEKVKVIFGEATGGATPDRDGFIDFERRLAARGSDRIELRYQLDKHEDVVGV